LPRNWFSMASQRWRCTATFLDHLLKIRRDGVADPIEDDAVHPSPPRIIGRSVVRDVLDQGVAL
jgi:hypothetical protein